MRAFLLILATTLVACGGERVRPAIDPPPPPEAGPELRAQVEQRLSFDPAVDPERWTVELSATGLDRAHGLVLELANWGEWLRLGDDFLRGLTADPPLRRRESRNVFDVQAPEDWDGRLWVRYELPLLPLGSKARESFGLLPYRAPSYCLGFAANTLAVLQWDDMPQEVGRWIEIAVPDDWTIATGYAAPVVGLLRARIPAGFENTVIAFGRPLAEAHASTGGTPLHVVQFGGEEARAAPLADFARAYLDACTRSLGVPPERPITLVVTEPGHGGTRTDGAIALGCPARIEAADPYTLHFLAHELFHDWLGGQLESKQGERLAWFWEGFTEYLSLWHLARGGWITRDWFAERVLDWERAALGCERWGSAAFADLEVDWRDPGVEPLAYNASALVALELDARLRAAGSPGLPALLAVLLSRDGGRYDLGSIRSWLVEQGLEDLWKERFERAGRWDPRPTLVAIGYRSVERPRPLSYVGLRLDREGPFGIVVAVDAGGPSAGKILVGDRVSGLTPTHAPIPGSEDAVPEFPFGLAYYEVAPEVRIDVERGASHEQVWVVPRTILGPPLVVLEPGPELDRFF
jgi:hypothetical protein